MLSKSEYGMLAFIAENDAVLPQVLQKRFGKSAGALLRRLERLHAAAPTTRPRGNGYIFTGEYSATGEGFVLLSEYRHARREKWYDRFFTFFNGFLTGVTASTGSYLIVRWLSE